MTQDPALLLGRLLASILFIISGYGKLMGGAAAQGYFAKIGLPLPIVAYWLAVAAELGGGILLLIGFQTRLVAAGLAVFCIATALLGHRFWIDPAQTINFEKNLAMAGGFLAFLAAGAGRFSIDGMMGREAPLYRETY